MSQADLTSTNVLNRRLFIGGSDARVIMGGDEAALLRLWREKRGEAEPEDLSGNLVVQLGAATDVGNNLFEFVDTQPLAPQTRFYRVKAP